MTIRKLSDQGFDDFRKERKRLQARLGPTGANQDYQNQALRELEQVEAREVRDKQLTREVHDFFAEATRQAASIVEKVARDALQETGERVEQEMESFLFDSLARMNTFVLTVLKERRGPIAETRKEPSVVNLVGPRLDEFRFEGTADVEDRHIGQDPFATPVDDVQREFREQVGTPSCDTDAGALPIDQHLVATVEDETGEPDAAPSPAPEPAKAAAAPLPEVAPRPRTTAASAPASAPASREDLDRFKEALKALVRQGMMTREEAKAAWQVRTQGASPRR